MEQRPTVWVVYNDGRRNLSKAERYGVLKDVFVHQVKDDAWKAAVDHVRYLFQDYRDGDYILPVGSHIMTAVVTTVALEHSETQEVKFLPWDNREFDYKDFAVDFSDIDPKEDV